MKVLPVLTLFMVVTSAAYWCGSFVMKRGLNAAHSAERVKWDKARLALAASLTAEQEKARVLGDRLQALAFETTASERSLHSQTSELAKSQQNLKAVLEEEQQRAANAVAIAERAINSDQTEKEHIYAEGWNAAVAEINAKIEAAQAAGARPGAIFIQTGSPPPPSTEPR